MQPQSVPGVGGAVGGGDHGSHHTDPDTADDQEHDEQFILHRVSGSDSAEDFAGMIPGGETTGVTDMVLLLGVGALRGARRITGPKAHIDSHPASVPL